MKRYKYLLCVICATSLLPSCGGQESSVPSSVVSVVQPFKIQGENQVGINEYLQLEIPTYSNNEITWSSSDTSIASISSSGMVKGRKAGKVTIRAEKKVDTTVFDQIEVIVHESLALDLVIGRMQKSPSYSASATGSIHYGQEDKKVEFKETFYADSYYFESSSPLFYDSYGLGVFDNLCFNYKINQNKVTDALFLRDEITDYKSLLYHMYTLPSAAFYNLKPEGDLYKITNTSIQNLLVSMLVQNMNTSEAQFVSSLAQSLSSMSMQVLDEYSFQVNYQFSTTNLEGEASLIFTLPEEKENTLLNTYLESNRPSYPEVYDDLTKMKELVKDHNYIRDLGNYRMNDGTSFPIGKCHYTKDYVYFDFSEQYIEATKNEDGSARYVDNGYITLKDNPNYKNGCYAFTYEKNANGEYEIKLGEIEKDDFEVAYENYYDFYENITYIFDELETSLYSFQPIDTDSGKSGVEYLSNSSAAKALTNTFFSDYVQAFDATSYGWMMAIDYSEENPENSIIDYAGVMGIQGSVTFQYSNYSYSSFGKANVSYLDDFIKVV